MAQIEINSFFTRGGTPATDLGTGPYVGYPTIRIWSVNGSTYDLVVGSPSGSGQNTDGIMASVTESGQQDGFYSFVFADSIGYSEGEKYLIRADGGPSLTPAERYQVAEITPTGTATLTPSDITNIANATANQVWDEVATDHTTTGTTGLVLNQIRANTESLVLNIADVTDLVTLLLKYETNRTRIDTTAKTLTVYDNDCTTPLRVFTLHDSVGNLSTDLVAERVPVSASDGQPVCS